MFSFRFCAIFLEFPLGVLLTTVQQNPKIAKICHLSNTGGVVFTKILQRTNTGKTYNEGINYILRVIEHVGLDVKTQHMFSQGPIYKKM